VIDVGNIENVGVATIQKPDAIALTAAARRSAGLSAVARPFSASFAETRRSLGEGGEVGPASEADTTPMREA